MASMNGSPLVLRAVRAAVAASKPKGSHKCLHPGCLGTTREKKPYCSRHVHKHPYASSVIAEIAHREREINRVACDPSSARAGDGTAKELLVHLIQAETLTLKRLSRHMNLPLEIVQAYASALERAGKVTLDRSSRGRDRATLARDVEPL